MQEGTKWAGSVIFKLVGTILGGIVTLITVVGVAIFQAVENPDGKGKDASLFDYISKMLKKKPNKKEENSN